mmetsp:Transcript_7959/g.18173  ORF Transcript_7959/g.18173 Transcript_7959/m.18173 type:complete len:373 (-) Transcript_7959:371-1489(-)
MQSTHERKAISSSRDDGDLEEAKLLRDDTQGKPRSSHDNGPPAPGGGISSTGLKVLALLAVQNCSKNLIMRYAVQDKPDFLYSAAVIGSEATKLTLSTLYILLVDKGSISSILHFLRLDWWNAVLLTVPAAVYNLQQTLEYVALSNLDAAVFSVLVQSKLLCTALFAVVLMGMKLRKAQVISLVLLTTGVMLANIKTAAPPAGGMLTERELAMDSATGIAATLGISLASGFAAVYTEKVIKSQKAGPIDRSKYSLAYMQVQLAGMSLLVMGAWALAKDHQVIMERGLWHNVDGAAMLAILNSATGGLIVAGVLKFADSVLKGYATAVSVMLTGTLSMFFFGTSLTSTYLIGMVNVIMSVVLYNAKGLEENMF